MNGKQNNESKINKMEKQTTTDISVKERKSFSLGWEMMPQGAVQDSKEEMKRICGWNSDTTFYNKLNGQTPISPAEAIQVENIFERFRINAWSGERI